MNVYFGIMRINILIIDNIFNQMVKIIHQRIVLFQLIKIQMKRFDDIDDS